MNQELLAKSPVLLTTKYKLQATHRWASTSISMSAISDIRHRHLLFRYRRQIYRTEKPHSVMGSVLISTSEFIPISDIEEKNISSWRFESAILGLVSERFNTKMLWLLVKCDVGYRISDKTLFYILYNVGLRSLTVRYQSEVPISGSVRYRWSQISD
jgi:hypothetical protein